jgi:hypothetical protein
VLGKPPRASLIIIIAKTISQRSLRGRIGNSHEFTASERRGGNDVGEEMSRFERVSSALLFFRWEKRQKHDLIRSLTGVDGEEDEKGINNM